MPITSLPVISPNHDLGRDTVRICNDVTDSGRAVQFLLESLMVCQNCGEYLPGRITEEAVYLDGECGFVDQPTVTRLEVPSGKLIISTDLRPVYDGYDDTYEKFAPYSTKMGLSQVVEEFARQGCAFGFVGSRWPDLFQTGEDTYALASLGWDSELDDIAEPPSGWTRIGEIGGAVWSYSLADFGDWVNRGGDIKNLDADAEIVAIPAGTYEFTYHGTEKEFNYDVAGTVLFTHIKRIA